MASSGRGSRLPSSRLPARARKWTQFIAPPRKSQAARLAQHGDVNVATPAELWERLAQAHEHHRRNRPEAGPSACTALSTLAHYLVRPELALEAHGPRSRRTCSPLAHPTWWEVHSVTRRYRRRAHVHGSTLSPASTSISNLGEPSAACAAGGWWRRQTELAQLASRLPDAGRPPAIQGR